MNPYLMLVCAVLASAIPPMLGAQSEPPAAQRAHDPQAAESRRPWE